MTALIVDDSIFIRDYLRQHLERMRCASAATWRSGNACTRDGWSGNEFDVMMLDVNMPVNLRAGVRAATARGRVWPRR